MKCLGAFDEAQPVTIASAATLDIGGARANSVTVTGTATVTALGVATAGARRSVFFSSALTLKHNAASLILPWGANIATAAGDTATFLSTGAGNWRCTQYTAVADKTKLNGIAAGATANSPNATLLARANHTGTQAISTVSGLQAAVDRIDTDAKTNTATSGNTQSRSLTVTVSPTGATTQQQHSLSITTKYQSNNALSAGGWITSLRLENQVIGTANVDKSVAAACYTTVVGGAQLDKALGFEAVVSGLDGTSNINQGSGFYSANLVSVPGIERINRYYAFANDWKDGSIKNVGRYLKAQDVVGGSILREVGPTDHPGYVAGRYYGPKTTYNLQPLALIAGFGYITPFYCAERTTFDKIGIRLVTPVAGSTLRLGVAYLENGVPTYLVYGSAAIASTTAGDIEATGINTSLEAGVYALVVVSTGAITINAVTAFWSRDFFGRSSSVTDDSTPLLGIGAGALPSVMPAPAGYFATNGTIPDIWLRK